jgi:cation transport regulator ChaB
MTLARCLSDLESARQLVNSGLAQIFTPSTPAKPLARRRDAYGRNAASHCVNWRAVQNSAQRWFTISRWGGGGATRSRNACHHCWRNDNGAEVAS